MAVTFKIPIAATPERVFDELAHVERHPSWANPVAQMTMEQTAGEGPGATSRYRSSGMFVKKPVSADIQVTSYDPPRRFAIRSDQHQAGKKDVWYENTYTLEPSDGGTLLTKHVTGSVSPIVLFIAYPAVRKDAMTALRRLKGKLETGA